MLILKRKFKSRKRKFYKFILFGPAILITLLAVISLSSLITTPFPTSLFIITPLFFWLYLFILWNFTFYILKAEHLIVYYSGLPLKKIKLEDITGFSHSEYGLWIYGLSKNVLTLKLKNGKRLNITPEKEKEFIQIIESKIKAT